MHGHVGGGGGLLTTFFPILAVFTPLGLILFVGFWLDFEKEPMYWIGEFWFPSLLIVVATIFAIRKGARGR